MSDPLPANPEGREVVMHLDDGEDELLRYLVKMHHQWRPNKDADKWVTSACYFLRKLLPVGVAREGEAS